MKPIAVIGCARSGTSYTARLLQDHGVRLKHEYLSVGGIVSWLHTPVLDPKQITLVHQVRHPLAVIASLPTIKKSSWTYIYQYLPEIDPESPMLVQCMQYWVGWNQLAGCRAAFTYRIEKIAAALPLICAKIGVQPNLDVIKAMATTTNTRAHYKQYHRVTWHDLAAQNAQLCAEVQKLAITYGYALQPDRAKS